MAKSASARRAAKTAKAEAKRKEAEAKRAARAQAKAAKEAKSKAMVVATAEEVDGLVAQLKMLVDNACDRFATDMRAAAEVAYRCPNLQPAARKRTGMRVLLIEDDSATAQSIELMLKSEGFNVYTTDLGEEGIDLGKVYDYDIILLDLNLPDMSGFEVLRSLRLSRVKTPTLILSGLAGIKDKVKGFGFGADDYMTRAVSV